MPDVPDEPMTLTGLLAQEDQAVAGATVTAAQIAAFYNALKVAGLSAALANGLTYRYTDWLFDQENSD